jgi:tripartite-type tricarboxylate transporter receptor subunit TctC
MIRKALYSLPLLAALTGAALAVLAGAAAAQDYPNRPVKFITGFPPGGNVDLIARLVGAEMQKTLGQSVVVEAKPGAGGALAAEMIARSEPDGYTLMIVASAHAAQGALSKTKRYDVVDDFTWISLISQYPFLIAVRKDSRFTSLKQLLAEGKAKPGDLKYSSAGVGSILHTTVELLGHETKTKFLHIPYRGEAPALTALLAGEVDFIAATTGPITPRIKSGEFRALAVTGTARWPDLPDVPTVQEQGVPGFEVMSWTGLAGPPKLPKPILDKLNAEIRRAVAVPEVNSRLKAMGGEPRATTSEEFRTLVQTQYGTWGRLVREAGLSID